MMAQKIDSLITGSKASLRGLSVVTDKIIWASGSGGTVLRSTDGGSSFENIAVPGYERTDFRDIEAFSKKHAVIMGIDTPAVILVTKDGGLSWQRGFYDTTSGMFLDAMEFWNEQSGIVIGDPIEGKFFVARTFDGGKKWESIPLKNRPDAQKGEACFAASGTNVVKIKNDEAVFVTGGMVSRLHVRDKQIALPLQQGKETAGANGMAAKNKSNYMVVGGDFNAANDSSGTCTYTTDAGNTFLRPLKSPGGYRSGVAFIKADTWVVCGLTGADISFDGGQHFDTISKTGYHVVKKAKKGKAVFFAGGNGRIGKMLPD